MNDIVDMEALYRETGLKPDCVCVDVEDSIAEAIERGQNKYDSSKFNRRSSHEEGDKSWRGTGSWGEMVEL